MSLKAQVVPPSPLSRRLVLHDCKQIYVLLHLAPPRPNRSAGSWLDVEGEQFLT